MSQTHDPLTIAYLALGAKAALTALQYENPRVDYCDRMGGELAYISRVIEHADMLDALADDVDLNGVFVYEVAEPFGEGFGRHFLSGEDFDVKAAARELIASIS